MAAYVGLFLPHASTLAPRLRRRLDSHGIDVRSFDLALPAGSAVTIDGTRLTWDGCDLTGLRAAYVHGFAFENPVIPKEPGVTDWSLWQTAYLADQQKFSFLFSLFSRLGAGGTAMHNGADTLLGGFSIANQLNRLRLAGLRVPQILVGNDDAAVHAFEHGRTVVWRTTTGRCAWQLFQDKQRAHLIRPDKPPVLLAELIEGPLLRALVAGGEVAFVLAHAAPDAGTVPDERLELMRRVVPPPETEAALRCAAAMLSANWCLISYVQTANGAVFYDVDCDPVIDELPPAVADAALDALAAALAGADPRLAGTALGDAVHERPALYQRRMLRILFEMEATKHAPAAPPSAT